MWLINSVDLNKFACHKGHLFQFTLPRLFYCDFIFFLCTFLWCLVMDDDHDGGFDYCEWMCEKGKDKE